MKFLILISVILAGIGFAACKTTPTPSASVPPTQEKQESTESRAATPSQSTESAPPATQEKSKTSRTTSPDGSESRPQDTKQKSQENQTASVGATQTKPEKADQNLSASRTASPQTTQSKLKEARDDLRVGQATEKRIAAELEKLKQSGTASVEDIRNYEAYHERIQAMVAENRKIVEKMEAAHARHSPGKKGSNAATADESQKQSDPSIPEEQTKDQVAALDRQLSASLSEFDAMLLKEMETIETESAAKMRDLAQEAAEAAKRLKEKGVDLGTGESESTGDGSKQSEQGEQGDDDNAVASKDQSSGGGPGSKRDPGSRYSKEDDDIVARQLREAAENETDPELKEKLWKEYEEYKRNTR